MRKFAIALAAFAAIATGMALTSPAQAEDAKIVIGGDHDRDRNVHRQQKKVVIIKHRNDHDHDHDHDRDHHHD